MSNLVIHLKAGESFTADGPCRVTFVRMDEWLGEKWQAVVGITADKSVNILRANAKHRVSPLAVVPADGEGEQESE